MEGKVKWYNRNKGYGFIEGDDGEEYFVHYTALKETGFIRENDRVAFEAAEGEKGKQAQNVTLLQKGSEIAAGEAPAEEAAPEEVTAEEPAQEEAPAEEATPEEAPAEEPAQEEAPAEEATPEEAPAEEPAQEEATPEEAPVEETSEEEKKEE
ncbi:MAG: cold shock domain-containing protein [Nanoarchaeota archaeon]|nr:cold shock domain-containing protein [Nanoarchaeota archaeon]